MLDSYLILSNTIAQLQYEYLYFLFCFQWKKSEWAKTSIQYNTDKAARLPVVDVSIKDIGESNQQFWIEIGHVCFT
jgi:hypothetical protein